MNKFELDHFIQHPGQLNLESLSRLENLINEFPYCQVLQLLFVKNLHVLNHFRFSNQLKLAAAYSSDRKKLKQLIEDTLNIPKSLKSDSFQPVAYRLKMEPDLIPKPEILPVKDDQKTDLLELIKKRLSEIKEEKSKEKITQNKFKAKNSELINKFIDEQPTITRGKAEFFKPLDWARQSTQENEDIVTETLAKIYLKQGHNDRAIKIYEKLCLVFPDKSSYFADQIRKIQNL